LIIRNFNSLPSTTGPIHDGAGEARNVPVFTTEDFDTALQFVNYTELPPKATIGIHPHGEDEEMYVVLEGEGIMIVNGQRKKVVAGDLVLNKPFWSHGLENTSDVTMRLLVFAAKKAKIEHG
jgi:uncharacterized cupin superfamily protein